MNSEGSEYAIDFDVRMIEFEINGEPGSFLGEHMWISGYNPSITAESRRLQDEETGETDQPATESESGTVTQDDEEDAFVSEFEDFSDLDDELDELIASAEDDEQARGTIIDEVDDALVTIIGISSKSTEDDLDHISFYKILKLDDVTYELYEFGSDVIQAKIFPSLHDADDMANNRAMLRP